MSSEEFDRVDWSRRYVCHKVVSAMQVKYWHHLGDDLVMVELVDDTKLELDREWWEAKNPFDRAGGYLVKYDDGYVSWSPKDALESGYTELNEETAR